MTKLEDYVLEGNLDDFKAQLLEGITEIPAYCVEIMKRAFGKDYSISPVLSCALSDMYEKAINDLLKEGKIIASYNFKDNEMKITVFSTSYARAKQ